MNRDDIIRMAREAGFELAMWQMSFGCEAKGTHEELTLFAKLVAAAERNACAKVCDLVAREIDDTNGNATYCAAAIRARGEQ